MTATPPESSNGGEKEPRSPGYRRAPPASHPTAVSSVYSDPGYSYHVHYGNSAVDGGDDRGGGYNSHVDYINSYSSPRDSYAEECWPQEGCCGSYQGGSGSGLGGLSGDDLELPIVLGALALGGLALYFLRMAITTNIKGRRRRRRWSSDNDLDQTADTVLNFLWSGKAAIIRCRMLYRRVVVVCGKNCLCFLHTNFMNCFLALCLQKVVWGYPSGKRLCMQYLSSIG